YTLSHTVAPLLLLSSPPATRDLPPPAAGHCRVAPTRPTAAPRRSAPRRRLARCHGRVGHREKPTVPGADLVLASRQRYVDLTAVWQPQRTDAERVTDRVCAAEQGQNFGPPLEAEKGD